ncbi:Na+/H+ antiporter NhaA [Xylanimonas oleitrophica]|uniref:Na(+)/H(+) antiporter NhaA n=1 Tax=Xylanimonas oleitrophica TaxID=2607479 RepID=A0A2W5X1M9_9MICO|nr:Na+/H+ antiporter NhaA [Xylanimonas oleitrophica]PZR54205.1 Na+/H+ antiporter NhaA [Xylanimonas oleitrophica]
MTEARTPQHPAPVASEPQEHRSRDRLGRLRRALSRETTGGALLLGAALLALVLANSPVREWYFRVSEAELGFGHLHMPVAAWAADGLLAVFFFTVGVELKHEFVAGSLRNPREAGVPMLAAVGGMVMPALIFTVLVNLLGDPGAVGGWAIPTATDIAFALAVLAVFGKGLPLAIRTFLLTLAVVDDLLAIVVIAVFYTSELHLGFLAASLAVVVVAGAVFRSRRPRWWLLLPLGAVAWAFMHASGVHATVAGVLLGFTVPAVVVHGERVPRTTHHEHALRPWSQGLALPVFAFFAAGVDIVDAGGLGEILRQPVVLAITAGLIVGKFAGMLGVTALVTRFTPLRLAQGIGVRDLLPIAFLAGIGFTVALLISELSYGQGSEHTDAAKFAILAASLISAALGAVCLRWDARKARSQDMNRDGVADDVTTLIGDPDVEEQQAVRADERPGPRP